MIEFPVTVEGDSDDVRWALETAGVMWAQGDSKEALRWLKKAAETASENGADMRSVALARFAADLRISLGPVPSEAPAPPELQIPAAPPVPADAPPSVRAPAARRALPRPPPPRKPAVEDPDEITPQPSAPSGSHAVPPAAISQPMGGDTPPAGAPVSVAPTPFEPAPMPFDHAPVVKPMDEPVPSSQPPAYSAAPPPIDTGSAELTLHQAVRVSIHPLEDQPGVFLTHVLSSGVPAPRGGYEALLVALDPRVQLIKRR